MDQKSFFKIILLSFACFFLDKVPKREIKPKYQKPKNEIRFSFQPFTKFLSSGRCKTPKSYLKFYFHTFLSISNLADKDDRNIFLSLPLYLSLTHTYTLTHTHTQIDTNTNTHINSLTHKHTTSRIISYLSFSFSHAHIKSQTRIKSEEYLFFLYKTQR